MESADNSTAGQGRVIFCSSNRERGKSDILRPIVHRNCPGSGHLSSDRPANLFAGTFGISTAVEVKKKVDKCLFVERGEEPLCLKKTLCRKRLQRLAHEISVLHVNPPQ